MHMVFDDAGYRVVTNLLAPEVVQTLLSELAQLKLEPLRGGIRRIDQLIPQVADLARSSNLLSAASIHVSSQPELVRAIYFDKTPENNWSVTWHQDRTVAVSQRFEADGWGPWSLKSDVWHVQPPIEVLQDMITIRVHLDAATAANGCLKVIPGSHRFGLLASGELQERTNKDHAVYCEVPMGGALIMRLNILHSSEKSAKSLPRRVLHFEYSSYKLPEGITWAT
jgi:ectoine hydroxylase-related dioxygenase (phytanoyl-CoA dioxygenase family)